MARLLLMLLFTYRGRVVFNSLPVPGATITTANVTTVSDADGYFVLSEVSGAIQVKMTGFATLTRDASGSRVWELKLLPLDAMQAETKTVKTTPVEALEEGLLINGSNSNGAASPFAQDPAFGNSRSGNQGKYNGGIGLILDNSALDARAFSLTGQPTPKPSYDHLTGSAVFGGPIKGANVFLGYQWTRNNNVTNGTGLMPTAAQRNELPASRISPQALALLNYYPQPNFAGSAIYNYQVPLVNPTHQDALQSRLERNVGQRDEIYGKFALQSTREDNSNLFGFLDHTDSMGINSSENWSHRFGHQLFLNLGYQFSRLATHVTPYFDYRTNVSALAGITGNDQTPVNWGPPTLIFSSGIASLGDVQRSFNRNQTSGVSYAVSWNHGGHNVTGGTDFRREEFNYLGQQNARGTFTFTGAATGNDFEDFLAGVPDTSQIAFGNADKYFRESVYDAYVTDDWRINPQMTLNAGVRWEYGAPITELYGRLVNLEIAPGFRAATPVVKSLLQPDRRGIEPRVGIAWRPISGSSMVVRAGYGIYYDTSVYQTLAVRMAQQPPLSKSLSVQNSAANPLTLANGFVASPGAPTHTFAVNPRYLVGYAQNWSLTVQRDLPWSMQLSASYLGIKGTHGTQDFLPNTYPVGAVNPCPSCPIGFAYVTSNGNSTRQSGELQLRRRLHNGLTGTLQYTFSKSIDDDAAVGGDRPSALQIAQNWLDLRAERGLSTFDQRHLLSFSAQYTTGMGYKGGTLLSGWRGAVFKEWTVATEVTFGSGLPETPIYLIAVPGTGFTGTVRASYTGKAFTAPLPGEWGNAGRDSITGPVQFGLNASLGRVFRLNDRLNLDLRFDSTNALNHVNYTTWNTVVNSPQFLSAAGTNAMRSVQTTVRIRF